MSVSRHADQGQESATEKNPSNAVMRLSLSHNPGVVVGVTHSIKVVSVPWRRYVPTITSFTDLVGYHHRCGGCYRDGRYQ